MEIAKEIITLIKDVAWPVAILTIALIFRRPIISVIGALISGEDKRHRNLKLKFGSFELESQLDAIAQERMKVIAEEPDLQKRLQMAKEPILVEEALKAIDAKGIEALNKLHSSLKNAFYINWYKPEDYGIKREVFLELAKLNLIAGTPMYDGDEIGFITSTGLALLERVNNMQPASETEPAPNKSLKPTAR